MKNNKIQHCFSFVKYIINNYIFLIESLYRKTNF